ncbi:MAG: caspase family protein [Sedimentisphaerales bacterium]|nr:caspase family protein [Sedimentisphaerales bacterium]
MEKRKRNSSLLLEFLEPRILLSANSLFTPGDIGDTFSSALELELDENGDATFESQIDNKRDQDVFLIMASGTGIMQVDMTTENSPLDSYLYVYNSQGQRITWNDDSDLGTDASVAFNVEEGQQYYIRADAYRRSTGSYTLHINGPQNGQTYVDDYSNSFSEAALIVLEETGQAVLEGEIGPPGDQDMFIFTAVADGLMRVEMSTPNSQLDSYIYIYDSSCNRLVQNDDSGPGTDALVIFYAEEGRQYYIQADAWRDSIGLYELNLSGPTAAADSEEPDESEETQLQPAPADGIIQGWAVLIGASDYAGSRNDLPECAIDVELMQETLIDVYHFPPESVHVVTGGAQEINITVVDEELTWLGENADGDDVALFYYTGHGDWGDWTWWDDNEALYLPDGRYFTESRMSEHIRQFNDDTSVVIILDTCYSGGFTSLAEVRANTWVLASSTYDQESWGYVRSYVPDGYTGSVFSSWLMEAMRDNGRLNVDTSQNGIISLQEAFNYADRNINSVTGYWFNNQNPVMAPESEDLDIILSSDLT